MSKVIAERGRVSAALAAAVVLAAALAYVTLRPAGAGHSPADKASAVGSRVEVVAPNDAEPVLTTTLRTSSPADLLLSVSAECSITTEVTTVGNDLQRAEGTLTVYVTVDGQPVPVAGTDDGRVVFCNRLYERETTMFDDEDATIRTFMRTRAANAFNWVALDVGSGIHTVEVHALLTTNTTDTASALGAVGNRTLLIEPTHMANDESTAN